MTVSVTGLGWAGEKRKAYRRKYEGREIVLVNPVALEGSLRVLYEKEKEVRERFVPVFLSKLYNSKNDLFAVRSGRKSGRVSCGFCKAGNRRRRVRSAVGIG